MENNILETRISLINNKVRFIAQAGTQPSLHIDYVPPFGDGQGYTSLELLLLSFSSCLASSIALLLRKMQKEVDNLRINATGIRHQEHPTGFKTIIFEIYLESDNVHEEDLNKVLQLSEQTYCPVWSMLKGNVELKVIPFISASVTRVYA